MLLITRGLGPAQTLTTQGLGTGTAPPVVTPDDRAPTGGAWPFWQELARRRESERKDLGITTQEQRKIDRAAVKIARSVKLAGSATPNSGLGLSDVSRETIAAAPDFDALVMALRPSEGQALALAQAILNRIVWAEAARLADEEAAIMALLMEV